MASYIVLVSAMVGLVSTTNEHDLQIHIMANYNSNVVPKHNSTPVVVRMQIVVEALVSVDEANEVINTKLFILLRWSDTYLTWQPKNFGNVSKTMLKLNQIWFPDIVVLNSVTEYKLLGFENMNVIVNYDGQVWWTPGVTSSTFCAIDTRLFPFDEQTCNIELYSWVITNKYIRFEVDPPMTTQYTYENGQWEITSTSIRLTEYDDHSLVSFGLNLKRRPMYYILSLIIPMVLISILNCVSFIIPKQSGERLSYSITVFLAFVLVLTLITGSLPRTSKQTSVLVVYLCTLLIISLMTTMASIICLAIESRINANGKNLQTLENQTGTPTVKEIAEDAIHNAKEHSELDDEGTGYLKKGSSSIAKTNLENKKRKLAGFFEYAAFFVVSASTVISSIVTYVILVKSR